MKKSMQFKEAQLAVLSNQKIEPQDKLEILSTLMECEKLEAFREMQEELVEKTEKLSCEEQEEGEDNE